MHPEFAERYGFWCGDESLRKVAVQTFNTVFVKKLPAIVGKANPCHRQERKEQKVLRTNCKSKLNLMVLLVMLISMTVMVTPTRAAITDSPTVANVTCSEFFLERMASGSELSRLTSGAGMIGVGTTLTLTGLGGGSENGGTVLAAVGLGYGALGLNNLRTPGKAEIALADVRKMSDITARERAGAVALKNLAASGRKGRMTFVYIFGGLTVLGLASGSLEGAAVPAGVTAGVYMGRSTAEMTYNQYLRTTAGQATISIGPRDPHTIQLTIAQAF